MSAPHAVPAEDWSELDALVGAELDIVLSRRPKPVIEPEAEEAAFLAGATAYLGRHPEPQRLIAEIVARFPVSETEEDPAVSNREEEPDDEPA